MRPQCLALPGLGPQLGVGEHQGNTGGLLVPAGCMARQCKDGLVPTGWRLAALGASQHSTGKGHRGGVQRLGRRSNNNAPPPPRQPRECKARCVFCMDQRHTAAHNSGTTTGARRNTGQAQPGNPHVEVLLDQGAVGEAHLSVVGGADNDCLVSEAHSVQRIQCVYLGQSRNGGRVQWWNQAGAQGAAALRRMGPIPLHP